MRKRTWDRFAAVYNLAMKKDRKAYEQMYWRIRRVIKGKRVLELATGTGLIARNVAMAAKEMEAVDFSPEMIAKAKEGEYPVNLHFAVADACRLPYGDHSFDAVIISNALHIMPKPERALEEIRRVIKPGGILIAPTFVHAGLKPDERLLSKMMGLAGFRVEHRWTEEQYLLFLAQNGCRVRNHAVLKASFPLAYAECTCSAKGFT